jgi:23S rRNA pseudouridine1911/1915/1917 synthase
LIALIVPEDSAGTRLDKWLAMQPEIEISRSRAQNLIAQGHVRLGEQPISDSARAVKAGECYTLTLPAPIPMELIPEAIPLTILYEDSALMVINKPAGMAVHPAPGHHSGTLVHALLAHCGTSLSGIGGVMRPGIVHRLDKDTSGLMVVAKHDRAHQYLSAQLKDRSLSRTYTALVWGIPNPAHGTWEGDIGRSPHNRHKMAVVDHGKEARTHYRIEQVLGHGALSLLRCDLDTGRTHQIRVHASHYGYPLVGDPLYGRTRARASALSEEEWVALRQFPRQALHATELVLIHPETDEEMAFECPLPEDMQQLLHLLRVKGK